MLKIRQVLLCLLLVVASIANAQSKKVSGQVTSEGDGEPMPGVSILVKGTDGGAITDNDGNFEVTVTDNNAVLVFSFIGMKTKEVKVGTASKLKITLSSSALSMDEVIVVGYGTTTKESFTGSATKIDSKSIESKNASNIAQALAGEAAGVQVISGNGQPGSAPSIRIRGIGSINGSRGPLYIVDGMPVQGDLNSIVPSDIESTTILKDASATAIYGSRGANGVVIITTKKGKSGKSEVEVDVKYGINFKMLKDYDYMTSPEEFIETGWQAVYTEGMLGGSADPAAYANDYLYHDRYGIDTKYNIWDADADKLIDPATGKFYAGINRKYTPEKWSDELFQNANRTEANLKISGGTEKNRFYTSFNVLDDKGYYLNSDFQRFSGRSNINHEIKTWLKGSMNTSFMHSVSNFAGGQDEDSNNGFWFVANMPSIYPVYAHDADGKLVPDNVLGGSVYDYGDGTYGTRGFASLTNAAASSNYDVVRQTRNQFSGNAKLEATFLKDFSLSSNFGVEYLNHAYDILGNAFYGGSAPQGGSIYKVKSDYLAYTSTNMLRYEKEYGAHNISAFVAQEASFLQYKTLNAFKSNLADPFSLELNNAVVSSPSGSYTVEQMLLSYFTQVTYDYDGKYFFQGVLRRDGSSKFVNDKWGTFGSVGLAWMLSKEDFMESTSDIIDEIKIKSSYGVIGEQGGIGAYSGYDLYSVNNLNDNVSLSWDSKGNPDLTWEQSKMFQVGAEFKLFDRISGGIDYYIKNTDNLLISKQVPIGIGYASKLVNDGQMRNSGLEIVLDISVIETDDLYVNLGVNAAFERNEITEMPIDDATGKQKPIDISGLYGRSVGHSLYDIYTKEYVGVDTNTGAAQWNKYYNEVNGVKEYITDMETYKNDNKDNIGTIGKEVTSIYSEATKLFVDKSPIPKVRGSFNLEAGYRGFTINALFSYSLGGHGYDTNYADLMGDDYVGNNNWHKDIKGAWQKPGDITNIPAITNNTYNSTTLVNYGDANRASTRFITSTNYLSLNNVVLAYNFNKNVLEKIGLDGLKLYVSGSNLWVASKRQGFYPNTSEVGASSRYQYTPMTSITGGINIKF